MILIAPDKFKGTLTAKEAAAIIAKAVSPLPYIKAPMADGGEGTASILCSDCQWDKHDLYYVNRATRTAVIDSSAVMGLQGIPADKRNILRASSAPLGVKVREILKGGCEKVFIGIGGTATCDGGEGFLIGLGIDKLSTYRDRIVGLSDVAVPLVAPKGCPSALMFAPQKGATKADMPILRSRLEDMLRRYPDRRSPYDGAGGGLGFAIASAIGAPCLPGAKFVLDHYDIDWDKIKLVITGEGCIDEQTATGKVVSVLANECAMRGIPLVAFGGTVRPGLESENVISCDKYPPALAGGTIDKETAALRLEAAVKDFFRSRT